MIKTMFEYIADQNEPFSDKPFTPADAAILSTLSNINFSYFYNRKKKEKVNLGELAHDFLQVCKPNEHSWEYAFLKLIENSPRYSQILVSDVIDDVDLSEEKQFGALTFYPEEDLAYVGFTGTGTSVVGYKEDLNMAFMDVIPSQREAVNYINNLKDKLPQRVIVGGFSKGGNLAVFASAFAKPEVREKIETVYNHDGPGFSDLIINEAKYQTLKPLVKTYIPSASIVGILLNQDNDYKIIESSALPIAQHQPYTWYFEGDDLKVIDEISGASRMYRKMQKHLLGRMSEEERKETVNAIFNFITEIEPDDFLNLLRDDKKVSTKFKEAWKKLDRRTKRVLTRFIRIIARSLYHSMRPFKSKKRKRKAKAEYEQELKELNNLK